MAQRTMESQREFLMIAGDSSPWQYAGNAVLIIFSLISNISGMSENEICKTGKDPGRI